MQLLLRYSQLSISRVQFCSSRGYLLKSIMQAAVVVILRREDRKRTDRLSVGDHKDMERQEHTQSFNAFSSTQMKEKVKRRLEVIVSDRSTLTCCTIWRTTDMSATYSSCTLKAIILWLFVENTKAPQRFNNSQLAFKLILLSTFGQNRMYLSGFECM